MSTSAFASTAGASFSKLDVVYRREGTDVKTGEFVLRIDGVMAHSESARSKRDASAEQHYKEAHSSNLFCDTNNIHQVLKSAIRHSISTGIFSHEMMPDQITVYLENFESSPTDVGYTTPNFEIHMRPHKFKEFEVVHEFGHVIQFATGNSSDRILCEGGADLFALSHHLRGEKMERVESVIIPLYRQLRGLDSERIVRQLADAGTEWSLRDPSLKGDVGEVESLAEGGKIALISTVMNGFDLSRTLKEFFSASSISEIVSAINQKLLES